jgi:hypothetical protein
MSKRGASLVQPEFFRGFARHIGHCKCRVLNCAKGRSERDVAGLVYPGAVLSAAPRYPENCMPALITTPLAGACLLAARLARHSQFPEAGKGVRANLPSLAE